MTTYTGDLVSRRLEIPIPETEGFRELLGLALRVNKKRAHLLVSNVLGKHVPQRPHIIAQSCHSLALQLALHRSGGTLTDELRSQEVKKLLASMDSEAPVSRIEPVCDDPSLTVFGYAETATGLGGMLAYYLGASYLHSTRYPKDSNSYGSFDEVHSHASSHAITPRDWALLNDPAQTIVLTDDELSTGNTVMNTIRLLESHAHHEAYYVATLTDLRTEQAHETFRRFEEEMGVRVVVVSLIATELLVPASALSLASHALQELTSPPPARQNNLAEVTTVQTDFYSSPNSLGVSGEQLRRLAAQAREEASRLVVSPNEPMLALGVEENMLFPLMMACELELLGYDVMFSSATQSPVLPHSDPTYAVQDALTYQVDGGKLRYAYNVGSGRSRVLVFMENEAATTRNEDLIQELRKRSSLVTIVEQNEIVTPEPLTSPAFGSYPPEDVSWLLKDLSDLSLEAATEDREAAIQSGEAHYAESLPVEYIPSPEYQELFMDSLEENQQRLAEAVGLVSEQIYTLKNEEPVLVSLARAGTPVGVLIKRYLQAAHQYTAPHYAVSIVRGVGIDHNALLYLASHYDPSRVIFVDGWTGKGAITKELADTLTSFEKSTGIRFDATLAVLADTGSCVEVYGTRDDYLIPSACLNSTVSGLVSRTVFNELYIGPDDYHGGKFYRDFMPNDVSNHFVNSVADLFTEDLTASAGAKAMTHQPERPTWSGWKAVEEISEAYGIHDVNLVKPGVGETTRVLLRRVPWRVLVRPQDRAGLKHILMLAEQRGVEVEERSDLPYACVGLIHPRFNNDATGADGRAVS